MTAARVTARARGEGPGWELGKHGARCPSGDGARIQAGRSDKMSIVGLSAARQLIRTRDSRGRMDTPAWPPMTGTLMVAGSSPCTRGVVVHDIRGVGVHRFAQ